MKSSAYVPQSAYLNTASTFPGKGVLHRESLDGRYSYSCCFVNPVREVSQLWQLMVLHSVVSTKMWGGTRLEPDIS